MFEVQYINTPDFKAGWYIVERGIWIMNGPYFSRDLAESVLAEKGLALDLL